MTAAHVAGERILFCGLHQYTLMQTKLQLITTHWHRFSCPAGEHAALVSCASPQQHNRVWYWGAPVCEFVKVYHFWVQSDSKSEVFL